MPRPAQWLLIAALVVGAFLLGRWSRDADGATDATPGIASASGDAAPAPSDAPPTASTRAAAETPPANSSGAAPAMPPGGMPGQPAPVPEVPVSATAPGPQPLKPEDLPLLDKAQRAIASEGGTGSDLLDLARDEAQDDDARRVEALIAQTIRQKGGRYDQLRLSPPRCSRSVCLLRGVGMGHTQNPRSDWQRLQNLLMNEPAMREVVDDVRSLVTSEGQDTVYITLMVRCAPGTCRFANR